MAKEHLRLIEGGAGDGKLIEELPEQVEFKCPQCKASCIFRPSSRGVQHALPTCRAWQRIEGKKDDVERFLIKAGLHLLVPKGRA